MATAEKLKKHLDKAKEQLTELNKKAGTEKYNLEVRKKKKKTKRLARKVSKIAYMAKMLAEKSSKNKKGAVAAS